MTRTDRPYLAGILLGLLALALVGALTYPPLAARGDFAEQWAAARIVLEGRHPYDPGTWRDDAARLAGRASDSPVFVYPPYVTLALTPLAVLPREVAATLWAIAGVVIAAVALRALLLSYPPAHSLVSAGYGLALVASGPSLLALAQGQWDFLLLVAVCACALSRARGRAPTIGAPALLFKPQLAPFILLAIAASTDGPQRRRYLGAVGVALGLIAITVVALPSWWSSWYRGALGFSGALPIRTTTLATTSESLLGASGAFVAAAVVLVAVAVTLSFKTGTAAHLAMWLATGILIAPYIQAYDHLLLLAPLAIATGVAARRSSRAAGMAASAGLMVMLLLATLSAGLTMERGHDVIGALVPLAIWLLVVTVLWPDRRQGA